MTTLHLCRGLPASGKTWFAREFVEKNPRVIRVNRDDLRLLLHDGRFSKGNEKVVTQVQHGMIRDALGREQEVICDDTNLNPRTVRALEDLAKNANAGIEWHDFTDVPLWECIKRDAKRERSVGEDVIRSMWERHLMPALRERTGKPTCIIVDVDGTLAQMNGRRSPYAWDKVHLDTPNTMVRDVVNGLSSRHEIVVLSGRDGSCRDATYDWLKQHDVYFADLFMRTAGDTRPDYVVKKELLEEKVLVDWDPILAIDDRTQVVDLWRSEGIECWQVANGRF